MAAISGKSHCDFRYIGWWTRTFSTPGCPICDRYMKHVEDPYGLIWHCETCDWFTFFTPKKERNNE